MDGFPDERVHRDNANGLAGLSNRKAPARARRLDADQVADLAGWGEAGSDPAQDGLVRWRRKDGLVRWRRQDLQRRVVERFGVELHKRTGAVLCGQVSGDARLSSTVSAPVSVRPCLCVRVCAPVSVRPQHPKSDPGAQAVFKTSSARR